METDITPSMLITYLDKISVPPVDERITSYSAIQNYIYAILPNIIMLVLHAAQHPQAK